MESLEKTGCHEGCSLKTEDAVEMMRESRGNFECEVWKPGFEGSQAAFHTRECKKNRGHYRFIPAKTLGLRHLPKNIRNQIVLDWIWFVTALTVRLRIGLVSEARPEKTETIPSYPFYKCRGLEIPHTGTGLIKGIFQGVGPCRCRDCRTSGHHAQRFWIFNVKTACHVVYDTIEALSTDVDAFYDEDNEEANGKMKAVSGLQVIRKNEDEDWCVFQCTTHDEDLAEKLWVYLQLGPALRRKFEAFQRNRTCNSMCVIVSHPHGGPKMVTIGKVVERVKVEGQIDYQYTYDTDTCDGSSGAPVIVPWKNSSKHWPGSLSWTAVHSTWLKNGRNQSAAGIFHALKSKRMRHVLDKVATKVFHASDTGWVAISMCAIVSHIVMPKFFMDSIFDFLFDAISQNHVNILFRKRTKIKKQSEEQVKFIQLASDSV